jgi:hypothetical protein
MRQPGNPETPRRFLPHKRYFSRLEAPAGALVGVVPSAIHTQASRFRGFLVVLVLFGAARSAHGTTTEPNGQVVPILNTAEDAATVTLNGHHSTLPLFFSSRGELIDYSADAHTTPSIFSPRCSFTGTLVLHGGACQMDFGWYNVDPNDAAPPPDDQIFVLVPRNANGAFFPLIGDVDLSTFSSADIFADPRYKGGLIGFAIKNSMSASCPETHYSEQRLNAVCDDGSGHCPSAVGQAPGPAGHWILSVTYESTLTPNAYYLAFEDSPESARSTSDFDFNDQVYFITGISCLGSGVPCPTGRAGVCAGGVQQCTPTGGLSCVPTIAPSPEVCDGLDNDCDGVVDNGSNLCPAGTLCDRGACVATCGAATCPTNQVCTAAGVCGDAACQSVTCAAGTRCTSGTCVDPCAGVTCPIGQACRGGACADPCLGVRCDAGYTCTGGTCQLGCDCVPCSAGLACGAGNRCVPAACRDVTCAAGTTCKAGVCVDSCAGVACPAGQTCQTGNCVDSCGGVTCTSTQKCASGACVDKCQGVTCGTGQTCLTGACVDSCSATCMSGFSCQNGACVDPCAGVTCAAGTACRAGRCQDPCVGVTCLAGQKCATGTCVDACQGVTCPAGQTCLGGTCLTGCSDGGACATGQKCASELCVDACQGVTCEGASTCSDGACVDPCTLKTCVAGCAAGQCIDPCKDIVCAEGGTCQLGRCVDDAGVPIQDGAAGEAPDGEVTDGEATDVATATDAGADAGPHASAKSGCGCEVGTSRRDRASDLIGFACLAAVSIVAGRRRRSDRRRRDRPRAVSDLPS